MKDALRMGVGALNVWRNSTPRDLRDFAHYLQGLVDDEETEAELQLAVGLAIAADLLIDLTAGATGEHPDKILAKMVQAAETSSDE
ncbi:hypothetical protein [Actinoplanes sp. GCM10030250]|uniref:hypothetical protein n=1 Tax=Actinoplanes sp. GCM10030250 TaxID=3273376 RepID=UPI003616745F